jgi:hypothetical protein
MAVDADRYRLLRHATDLEAEAAELDRQASVSVTQAQPPGDSSMQPVEQAQRQEQQQGPEGPTDSEKPQD